jgi:NADH-quinone oxidoreductase subunit H
VHTTFEGDVEVAFAAAAPGAPPVAGTLREAVLDVRPSASPADLALDAEGARVLSFLGLHLAAPARRGLGLAVEGVESGSAAAAAGIVAGDSITRFDGVRVAAVGDLVPAPGEREARVGVRSGATTGGTTGATNRQHADDLPDAERAIAVDGFRRSPPAELLEAAALVAAALALLLMLGAPVPPGLGAALARASTRLRARPRPRAVLVAAAREVLPAPSASAVVDAVALALLGVLPFGQYLVATRLDVGFLFVVALTALAVVAVVAAGSAWGGLRAALHVAWQHVPAAIAVASVVVTTGSIRLQEIDRAQGGWPWDWIAFRTPAGLAALALLLACAQIVPDVLAPAPRTALEALVDDGPLAPPRSASHPRRLAPWLGAACRAHRLLVAGLASALFLGGWSLPGLSPAQQDGRPLLEMAGALCLAAKTGALVAVLAMLREAFPARSLVEGTRATTRRGVPLAIGVLAVTALWTRWSPEGAAQLLVSGSLLVVAVLAAVAVVQRLRHGLLAPGADGHLSTFL